MATAASTDNDATPEIPHPLHAQEHFHKICVSDAECHNGGKCGTQQMGSSLSHQELSNATSESFGIHKQCQCVEGYIGPACNLYCPKKCQNSGICQLIEDERVAAGDKGNTARPTDSLSSSTSKREHTSNYHHDHNHHKESFRCRCIGRFGGEFCEIPYEKCPDHSRCYNNGKCTSIYQQSSTVAEKEKYGCECPKGTGGERCDVVLEEPSVISKGKSIITKGKGEHLSNFQILGGVVIGIAFGLLFVAIILYGTVFVQRRRRQRRQRRHQQSGEEDGLEEIAITKLNLNVSKSTRQNQKIPKKSRKKKHHELIPTHEIFEDEIDTHCEIGEDSTKFRLTV